MSLSTAFRLSFYVSLAISCICLFYSEWDFLPWATLMLPFVLGLMVIAYRREGRAYLSVLTANRLGTCIGIGTMLWIALKVPRSPQDVVAGGIPWPAALVPLLSPLLPILLMVKLFRPKSLTDFWVIQTISMVIVTISCIMAAEVWFFILLLFYLVSEAWCLSLFFLYRNMVLAGNMNLHPSRVPLFGKKQVQDPTRVPWPHLGMRRALRWSFPVVVLGMALFFVMPRNGDSAWIPGKLTSGPDTLKSGVDSTTGLDLSREGVVELSKDRAFTVQAHDPHGEPVLLSLTQTWRVQTLDEYKEGRWQSSTVTPTFVLKSDVHRLPGKPELRGTFPDKVPAQMKEGQVFLSFDVKVKEAGGLPLADPVGPPEHVGLFPQADGEPFKTDFFRQLRDCDILLAQNSRDYGRVRRLQHRYGQIIQAGRGTEIPAPFISDRYVNHILDQPVPGEIVAWTRSLLGKLKSLDGEDRDLDNEGRPAPSRQGKIAQALCRHLNSSGEFTYSLKKHRLGLTMADPTAEFLLKVKEGHCERYAAGLAQMLRSLKIPARLVKGYSGCEPTDKGKYLIRQDAAHMWVEALVPGRDGTPVWLQLDPTPSLTAGEDTGGTFFRWIWNRFANPDYLWKSLIVDYSPDRQGELSDHLMALWTGLADDSPGGSGWNAPRALIRGTVVFLIVLVVTAFGVWTGRRLFVGGRRGASPAVSYYARLLKVLERCCQLRPHLGQTPLEFAACAQGAIAIRLGPTATLAELPGRIVALLYGLRFGGQFQSDIECRALENQVAELETALRK